LILISLSVIISQNPIESLSPKEVIDLFEENYRKAKIDPNFVLYYIYFKQKLNDNYFAEADKYKGYDAFFFTFDKSSQLYYIRNPPKSYKVAFPNEDYYLWRIMVKYKNGYKLL